MKLKVIFIKTVILKIVKNRKKHLLEKKTNLAKKKPNSANEM